MNSTGNHEARTERMKQTSNERFDKFMSNPLTRMAISTIPAGEHKDALILVIRAAFDEGVECGQGGFAAEMLEMMMKDRDKK